MIRVTPDGTEIANFFGLGTLVAEPEELHGGVSTDAWVFTTSRGRWVVKTDQLRGDWHRDAKQRAHCLEHAAFAADLPMPRPIDPPAPAIGYWHDTGTVLVRVAEWVEGRDLRTSSAPPPTRWLGTMLGRVVGLDLTADLDDDGSTPVHPIPEWREWVAEAEARSLVVAGPARSLLATVEDATAIVLAASAEAPQAYLAHRDVSAANVVRTPRGLSLIDWDHAGPEVPWWETVGVAFDFAQALSGDDGQDPGAQRVVREVVEAYADAGGPIGAADVSAFAGVLRSTLGFTAWCLWLALGHRDADAERQAFGAREVATASRTLPRVVSSLERWSAYLR